MRDALLDILVDPTDGASLTATRIEREGGEIVSGALSTKTGRSFAITRGIPRFVERTDEGQAQVEGSFAFKWHQQHSYSSPGMMDESRKWLVARYGFDSAPAMAKYFSARGRILDAGCGGGWSASLWLGPEWTGPQWVGLDISNAIDVAKARVGAFTNTEFVQADVMAMPFKPGTFDVVFSEGVLHHTPSTERAFQSAASMVAPGGELMAYIYRRKGPVREFADDHLRAQLSPLAPEIAWEKLRPLTRLAESLAGLHATIEIPEDIELLGIPAGTHDVQRLMYWHFAKMFWNDRYTFEENHHINFDWYHPAYAHRHTAEEIERWCRDAGLTISRLDVQESGYTVRAQR